MATIETVSIEDVYPLVDEFGNPMATRDYSKKENQKYVEELAKSMKAKGVPDEMVTLVRDGSIFRVKAGNSRVEAMRKLGTKRFEAIVEDESTEQAIIETVIRTNTKKKYEDLEMSSFVRQLAMFGDDEYVAETANLETEDVAKMRKAVEIVDDAAEDMSLFRLMTIGEFADDPEAVEKLTNCSEKDYERIADDLRRQREKTQREQEMRAVFEEMGVKIADSAGTGMSFKMNVANASDIPKSLPEESVAVYGKFSGNYAIYIPKQDVEVDPEKEKAKAQIAEICDLYEVTRENRVKWFVENIDKDLSEIFALGVGECDPYIYTVSNFLNQHELEIQDRPARTIHAYVCHTGNIIYTYERNLTFGDGKCEDFIALTDAMKKHGYEPCAEEETLYDLAQEHLTDKEA